MLYVHIIIESGDVTLTRSTKLEIKEEKRKKKTKQKLAQLVGRRTPGYSNHISSFNLKDMYTLIYSRMHDPGGIL